ncbi:MAG TPA: hypothetical protein VLY04_02460 [Bryobacteraceae bacterium]|nr:hypothetical protein [Bryobacteraceae bacterium]
MPVGSFLERLSPYLRVGSAVAPIVIAIVLRLWYGKTRLTRVILSVTAMWFAANLLMLPYSQSMRQEVSRIRARFR